MPGVSTEGFRGHPGEWELSDKGIHGKYFKEPTQERRWPVTKITNFINSLNPQIFFRSLPYTETVQGVWNALAECPF